MCGAAVPCTFFSRFTAGKGQTFARDLHAAESILSSDRQQIAAGLSVQAITFSAGRVMPAIVPPGDELAIGH
jgi:hypothetical protein